MTQQARQSSPLATVAADRIAALFDGSAVGTRLGTKSDLRREVGVSVGTFNEALRVLQARGLVSVRSGPGGGVFAAAQSPMTRLANSILALDADSSTVMDAIRIRDALDPLLTADALLHSSASDITLMREPLGRMAEAASRSDMTAFARANWALHAEIAAVSPSVILRSFYQSLLEIIESHTVSVLPAGETSKEDTYERYLLHVALIDAIEARDGRRAQTLTAVHATYAPATGAINLAT